MYNDLYIKSSLPFACRKSDYMGWIFFRMKPQKPSSRVEKDPSCSKDLGEEQRHQFCSFSSSVAKSSVSSIKRGDQQRTKNP